MALTIYMVLLLALYFWYLYVTNTHVQLYGAIFGYNVHKGDIFEYRHAEKSNPFSESENLFVKILEVKGKWVQYKSHKEGYVSEIKLSEFVTMYKMAIPCHTVDA